MISFAFGETVEIILCLLLTVEMIREVREVNLQSVCFTFVFVTDVLWSITLE